MDYRELQINEKRFIIFRDTVLIGKYIILKITDGAIGFVKEDGSHTLWIPKSVIEGKSKVVENKQNVKIVLPNWFKTQTYFMGKLIVI